MPPAMQALKNEPKAKAEPETKPVTRRFQVAAPPGHLPPRLPNALAGAEQRKPPIRAVAVPAPKEARRKNGLDFQPRVPVLTGEATYRGRMLADGVISGELGTTGGALIVRQRPQGSQFDSSPELDGEISFKDILRINGHVAGKLTSPKGTLIVDSSAKVDADIDVAVALICGIVNGDVVGHERVELSSEAVVSGNIATRSLAIKPGAIFQGDCRMLENGNGKELRDPNEVRV